MQVLFDRYAPRGGLRHVDLATGHLVEIDVRDVPDDGWRRRWRVRIDALMQGCEGLEPLVDAGDAGAHRVFEVRACRDRDGERRRPCALKHAAAAAIEWLHARELSAGPCKPSRLLGDGRLCADAQTAWPIETSAERACAARALSAWRRLTGHVPARLGLTASGVSERVRGIRGMTDADAREACDERAGLVAFDVDVETALRHARGTGRVALDGGIAPSAVPADLRHRRSFLLIEPARQAAAEWAAALAAAGPRRHLYVARNTRTLVARERELSYRTVAPHAVAPPATQRARELLLRAQNHFAAHELAAAIRSAGRAALLAGEGSAARCEALTLKARALRCEGEPREAGALLGAEQQAHPDMCDAPFLVECAEAACDNALLQQAEAFARAALLASTHAASQLGAKLALDRARVWRGEPAVTPFWQARSAWHIRGAAPVWPARGGYAHAPCGNLAAWEHACDRLERALWLARGAEAARLKACLRASIPRLPPLLRARAGWLMSGETLAARRCGAHGVLQTGKAGAVMEIFEHMSALLTACHESGSDHAALMSAAARTRRAVRANTVAVFVTGTPLPVAGDGDRWNAPSSIAARCCQAAHTAGPESAGGASQIAVTIRGSDSPLGALLATWPSGIPLDVDRLRLFLEAAALVVAPVLRAWTALACAPSAGDMPEIVGVSPAIAAVRDAIRRVAGVPFAVVIEGESGAGKELVARAIHRLSPRTARPFRALNCAAMAEDLVEAELFGHAQGAYTGAVTARAGLFEDADRGTLFLDEVSELSPRAQAKLLRVLQEGEVRRVGETSPRRVDVRIVAASNRPLAAAVAANAFRADLLFRLDVLRISVPPLRARTEDVPVLCAHFWRESAPRAGTSAQLSPEALGRLASYPWPGNVRELQNVVAALAVSCPRRGRAGVEHLPAHIRGDVPPPMTLHQARATLERDLVRTALARAGGRPGRAAAELGLSRQGLAKLMRRLGLPAA